MHKAKRPEAGVGGDGFTLFFACRFVAARENVFGVCDPILGDVNIFLWCSCGSGGEGATDALG